MKTRQAVLALIAVFSAIGCQQTDTSAQESPRKSSSPGNAGEASDNPLAGYPATILDYELVRQNNNDFPDAEEAVRLRATVDAQEYAALVKRLQEMLRPNSKELGAGLLGLTDPSERRARGIVYFGPTSPATLTDAVNSAITDKKGCVVIVGKELKKQRWKESRTGPSARAPGGSLSIPIDWYWVSDKTARPLRNGFRRACEMKLQPVLETQDGKTPLPMIAPYSCSTQRVTDKTVLMPGGPGGHVFSAGTGGGDLNIAYARNSYMKSLLRNRKWPDTAIGKPEDVLPSERVLLFLPCMMVEGEFLARATIPVEIRIRAAQLEGRDHVEIKPVFP